MRGNYLPKVSIILATYNRSHLISETLESILSQSFQDWECLIVDDQSKDRTEETVEPFLQMDRRIKYFRRLPGTKKGLPASRNFGLELAKGDYVIFFDDDDIVHPHNLFHCVSVLENKSVDFCRYKKESFSGEFDYIFDRDFEVSTSLISIDDLENIIMNKLPFTSCSVMWKKKCFKNEKFNESLTYAEEWELYQRILSNGIQGISLNKVLYYARKHPDSITGEYWKGDPVRKTSMAKATLLAIDNLGKKGLLSSELVHYFLQQGFFLKESIVLKNVLHKSNAGFLKKIKYNWGYRIYPFLSPFFRLKSELKKRKIYK